MLIIDKFAYTNNLKDLNPKKKFSGYSMGLLLASLINKKEPLIFIAIISTCIAGTLRVLGERFH